MALSGNKTSVKSIINMLYRDTGIKDNINYGDLVEWAGDAMDLIAVPMTLEESIANENQYDTTKDPYITVSDYKAFMPCPWTEIVQIRDYNSKRKFIYSSNSFHPSSNQQDRRYQSSTSGTLTYKIKGNCIYTNIKTGKIEVIYKHYAVDEDNYPLIPVETQYRNAIKSYLQMKVDYILWRNNKLSEKVYRDSEQEWLFNVGQAENFSRTPSLDQMESWKNQMIRLIPDVNEHSSGFTDLSSPENKYNHD